MQDIQFPKPKIHAFICINDRTCRPNNTTPSCGPAITREMVKEVKRWVIEKGLTTKVYVTKVSCLGFCNINGGVMCIYPAGRFVQGIQNTDDIKEIIKEELSKV